MSGQGSMSVIISNRQDIVTVPLRTVKRALETFTSALDVGGKELSVVLTDDRGIEALNRKFLKRRGPTNVLSFPIGSGILLGDVVISVERTKEEAETSGIPFLDRLLFLAAHGILHIVGYDHERSRRDAKRMEEMEMRLMRLISGEHPSKARRVKREKRER